MSERTDQLLEAILSILMRQQQPSAEAVSVEKAAEMLGCSRARVFELLKDGTLRRTKRVGRKVMVLASSIDEARRMPELPTRAKRAKQPKQRAAAVEEYGENFGTRILAIRDRRRARAESARGTAAEPGRSGSAG